MKTVLIVKIEPVYISNDSCLPVTLTDNDKLLSSLFNDKYSFVEIYTPLKKFTAKTYKAIDILIDTYCKQNKCFDTHSIIIKN